MFVLLVLGCDEDGVVNSAEETPGQVCQMITLGNDGVAGNDCREDELAMYCCAADSVSCFYEVEDGRQWVCDPFDFCTAASEAMYCEVCGLNCR
jgi:hypothetical protein